MSLTFKTQYTQIVWSVYLTVSHIFGQSKMNERSPGSMLLDETEDTKGVIRIRILQKNRQHSGQKKSTNGQATIYKTYT